MNLVEIDIKVFEDKCVEKEGLVYLKSEETPFTGIFVSYHHELNGYPEGYNFFQKDYFNEGVMYKCETYFEPEVRKKKLLVPVVEIRETIKNGEVERLERYYESGLLKSLNNYSNKTYEGTQESYHSNGQLEYKLNYRNGVLIDGTYETYSPRGSLISKGNYKNGKPDGPHEMYYPSRVDGSSHLKSLNNYKNGKLEGPQENYVNKGQVTSRSYYKNGKPDGPHETYFLDGGQLKTLNNYKDGKLEGRQELYRGEYYEKGGPLELVEHYKGGIKEGLVQKFNKKGKLISEQTILKGKRHSPFKRYFDTGKLMFEGVYEKGKLEGKNIRYFENGKPEFKKNHKRGRLDGLQEYFDKKGNLVNRETYKDGKRVK
tara:strand:+ start:405 stop:1520 length:1116 start_codon:yes stop_codon:yes gene_type:complete